MLTNYHTHTNFCDGNNTPEEVVQAAIDMGFDAIGFSGHGYTDYDLRYCMKNTAEYLILINNLKEKYKNKIEVYAGVEEDSYCYVNRSDFDYILGSSHYLVKDNQYLPIDSDYDGFKECLKAFDGDVLALAEGYYSNFAEYITKRKPDIVGHFDLITKYDELDGEMRFLNNEAYLEIACKYMSEALKNDVIFEVNTGAISRGYRKSPYPHERLLHLIKKEGGKVILSADSHDVTTLCAYFDDAKQILKDAGFSYVYVLYDGTFKKDYI